MSWKCKQHVMRFLPWPWISESFANSCAPQSAKLTKRKKYFFHSCGNRYSANEIWGYKCSWSYWYADPTCRRAFPLQWEHFVFPAPPAKPEGGMHCAKQPLNTSMEQVLLPADLCLIVNWSFSKDVAADSASLYCLVSNKVWAVAVLFSQLENLRGLCLQLLVCIECKDIYSIYLLPILHPRKIRLARLVNRIKMYGRKVANRNVHLNILSKWRIFISLCGRSLLISHCLSLEQTFLKIF